MRLYSLIFTCVLLVQVSKAQTSFDVKVLSELQGLSSNRINDIVQDKNGYIWLATDVGVSRFDGENFLNFPDDIAIKLFQDKKISKLVLYDDTLYLVFDVQGCIGFNVNDYGARIITSEPVSDFYKASPNEYYIFFRDKGISYYQSGMCVETASFSGRNNSFLFINDSSMYAVIYDLGLCRINKVSLEVIHSIPISSPVVLSNRVVVSEEEFFLQLPNAIRRFTFDLVDQGNYFHESSIRAINNFTSLGPPSDFCFFNSNQNLYLFSNGHLALANLHPILFNYEFRCVYPFEGGGILIGTNSGLLVLKESNLGNRNTNFLPNPSREKVPVRRRILEDSLGNFYFFGFPSLTVSSDTHVRKSYAFDNAISTYDALFFNNQIIATTEGWGLVIFNPQNEKWALAKTTLPIKYEGHHLNSIISVNNNRVFSCGNIGLVEFSIHDSTYAHFSHDLRLQQPGHSLEYLPESNHLLLAVDNFIYVINLSTKEIEHKIRLNSLKSVEVVYPRTMKVSLKKDFLYVGTNVGLYKIRLQGFQIVDILTDSDRLIDNRVLNIIEDEQQRLWISTFKGIQAFNLEAGKDLKLYSRDVLINKEFNYTSALKTQDGRLIFGGLQGYDIINLSDFKSFVSDFQPKITAYSLIDNKNKKVWSTSYDFDRPITFFTGRQSLIIYVSSLDIVEMSNYVIEYQINDFQWSRLEGSRMISLIGLDEGWHSLNVRMYDQIGRSLSQELHVRIHAKKVFFESRNFLYLFISLVFILLFFIIQIRRKEYKVKKQVSMDLHDEVGTLITRALLISQSLQKNTIIEGALREALYSLRLYINSMMKNSVKVQVLQDEATSFVVNHFESENVLLDLKWDVLNSDFISSELYRNLRMIIFELCNNCLKHANATRFTLQFTKKNDCILLVVYDDGNFDADKIKRKNGNGLRNILKRVEKMGGECNFSTSILGGLQTTIKIKVK